MNIALDYDQTFTADPKALTNVCRAFQRCGHTVTFVTYRDSRWENHDISTIVRFKDLGNMYDGCLANGDTE